MAEMPAGVAAPPMPRRFADMFTAMCPSVSSSFTRNSREVTGFNPFASARVSFASSAIFKKPSHTVYTAASVTPSFKALSAPESSAGRKDSGENKSTAAEDTRKTSANKTFINLSPFRGILCARRQNKNRRKDFARENAKPPPRTGRRFGRKGDTSRRLASAYPPQPNNAESESHWCVGYTRPRILNAFGL